MSENRYKNAMDSEMIDETKFDELCQKINDCSYTRTMPAAAKRRISPRALAAVIAAAAAIAVISVTALAVGRGLAELSKHEENINSKVNPYGAIPTIDDPEKYADDMYIEGMAENSDSAGQFGAGISPVLTAASGDGHTVIAMIQVNASGMTIPDGARFGFRAVSDNLHSSEFPPEFVSIEGGICTFAYTRASIRDLPETVEIELSDFGYYFGEDFTPLEEGSYKISVDRKNLSTVGGLVKLSGPQEVRGAELNVEITPLGITVYGQYSKLQELGLWDDKYFLSQPNGVEIHMRDGSVIGNAEDYFSSELYDLVCTVNGWVDLENDIGYNHYGFELPLDTDEVAAVSVHGVMFEFGEE